MRLSLFAAALLGMAHGVLLNESDETVGIADDYAQVDVMGKGEGKSLGEGEGTA